MDINKGVELILKGDKKKPPKQTPKVFDIKLSLIGSCLLYTSDAADE